MTCYCMLCVSVCVRVCVCVRKRMFFNSRKASSLIEADIGAAVHEIMGIMNKV